MRMQVLIRLKPGVLDVQGKAIENGVPSIGVKGISDVRVGKLIEFSMDGERNIAEAKVKDLCEKLLANTVIENFEIKVVE